MLLSTKATLERAREVWDQILGALSAENHHTAEDRAKRASGIIAAALIAERKAALEEAQRQLRMDQEGITEQDIAETMPPKQEAKC